MMQVREPNDSDCNLMFRWRNDPAVRAMSRNQDYIQWHEHEKWFKEKTLSAHCDLVMICLGEARIGVGRLDFDDDNGAEFSLYLNPDLIGKRVGVAATKALLKHGFETLDLFEIYGETLMINHAARACFTKAGMVVHFDKQESVRFRITRDSWKILSQQP